MLGIENLSISSRTENKTKTMTNSETFNHIISAYCCQQMYPVDMLEIRVNSKFYNHWASTPEHKLYDELTALCFSIGHEGLLFHPSITGVIGYHLFRTLTGHTTHRFCNDTCMHWVAQWLSLSSCDFDSEIPSNLLLDETSLTLAALL